MRAAGASAGPRSVTSIPTPPGATGADLAGSGRTPVTPGGDPLFDGPEREEQSPRAVRLLWQFFFFPLLIVAGCLLPIVVILATRGGAPEPKDLLEQVLKGSENAQKQAAQQLAFEIAKARTAADRAAASGAALAQPPFFVEPGFAQGLRHAFRLARSEEQSDERQMWLAQALGRTGDPEAVALLLDVLRPGPAASSGSAPSRPRPSSDVRRAAALGLLFLESRDAQEALAQASQDPDDGEVRAIAMNGLALLGRLPGSEPESVRAALVRGLTDVHNGVRLNAAVGLALRGDARGLDVLERSLSRADLAGLDVNEPTLQTHALVNAVRAVVALSARPWGAADDALVARLDLLKPRIATLAADDGDPNVRKIAAEGLDRWRKN